MALLKGTAFDMLDRTFEEDNLRCCDTYEYGVGYVFSRCDDIDVAYLLKELMADANNDKYKNMPVDENKLNWDWEALRSLINAYKRIGDGDLGEEISGEVDWRSIDIDWDGCQKIATDVPDMANWTLEQLKHFIEEYTKFALNAVGEKIGNVTGSDENVFDNGKGPDIGAEGDG